MLCPKNKPEIFGEFMKDKFPKAAQHKGACFDYSGWFEGRKEVCKIKYFKPRWPTKTQIAKAEKEAAKLSKAFGLI